MKNNNLHTQISQSHSPLRLFLFLFLLQSLGDGGGSSGGGVDALRYGETCQKNLQCKDTRWCNKETKQCDCLEFKSPNTNIPGTQVYDMVKKRCFSAVGTLCVNKEKDRDDYYEMGCVPNANCTRNKDDGRLKDLPDKYGICHCKPGYQKDYTFLCEKVDEQVILKEIYGSQFDGKKGIPTDGSNNEVSVLSAASAAMPKPQKVKDDESNRGIDVNERKLVILQKSGARSMSISSKIVTFSPILLALVLNNYLSS